MGESESPQENPLLNERVFARLPRWAQVAFIARCARRVHPLQEHFAPEDEYREAIGLEIAFAEGCAKAGRVVSMPRKQMGHLSEIHPAAAWAAHAAYPLSWIIKNSERGATFCMKAAEDAAKSANGIDENVVEPLVVAMMHDAQSLMRAAEAEGWSDDTPVAPEFFGPLWPNGEPDEWPEELKQQTATEQRLTLSFIVPPGLDTNEKRREYRERLREVLLAANALHWAHGGRGLKIDDVKVLARTRAPQPAGGNP